MQVKYIVCYEYEFEIEEFIKFCEEYFLGATFINESMIDNALALFTDNKDCYDIFSDEESVLTITKLVQNAINKR